MKFVKATFVASLMTLTTTFSVDAHNVWCHCAKEDAQSALAFIHKAGEVYVALADAMQVWDGANRPTRNWCAC